MASGPANYVEDLTDEFVNEFVIPTMQAGADCGRRYLWEPDKPAPILAKLSWKLQKAEGGCCYHGSTGKGNDQVRFELHAFMHCAGNENHYTVAGMGYSKAAMGVVHDPSYPLKINRETNYSDKNLASLSHEDWIWRPR